MQGRSPKPRRRRPCPAQAAWPHRRTRWEALRHTVSGDDVTWRGLIPGDKKAPADPNRRRLAGLSAARLQLRSGCESVTTLVAPHHMATSSGKSLSVHPLAGEEVCVVATAAAGTTRRHHVFQTERKAPIIEAGVRKTLARIGEVARVPLARPSASAAAWL